MCFFIIIVTNIYIELGIVQVKNTFVITFFDILVLPFLVTYKCICDQLKLADNIIILAMSTNRSGYNSVRHTPYCFLFTL